MDRRARRRLEAYCTLLSLDFHDISCSTVDLVAALNASFCNPQTTAQTIVIPNAVSEKSHH
jgi:hypothetical protein